MTLTHDEMVEILEEIARNSSNQSARIAAIRQLREIGDGDPKRSDFDQLDEIRRKAAA